MEKQRYNGKEKYKGKYPCKKKENNMLIFPFVTVDNDDYYSINE